MALKVGLEMEFHLIDSSGNIVNDADLVVSSPDNDGNIIPELSRSMVEVIAKPGDNLKDTFSNFYSALNRLEGIVGKMGLRVLPSSTIGRNVNVVSNDSRRQRGQWKRAILGDFKRDLEHHICGTHVHIDKPLTDIQIYNQYVTFLAMDPLFSLMSSTPFFNGENTKKDYRVELYRNVVFSDFPLQGKLPGYPLNFSDILEVQKKSCSDWHLLGKSIGVDDPVSNEYNTVWGPLRLSPKTIESRSSDVTLFSRVMALASVYKSIAEFLVEKNPEIVIDFLGEYGVSDYFNMSRGKLILPSRDFLLYCQEVGIHESLQNEVLRKYLSNIVDLSKQYVENVSYIEPFFDTTKNFSDEIILFAKVMDLESGTSLIDDNAACMVRNYIANRYKDDLKSVGRFF
ncbi:hypothetical protein JXM83_01735 [Candidatus Woesearchaeota archaeon]|nr:hypothetical protein [Candidatus Woesearchaeota archaeon]